MPLRAAYILLAALAVAAALSTGAAGAQTQPGDLDELWEQYPLEAPPDGQRPVGEREEKGSLAGPPPKPAQPAGPFPHALLFLALALGVVCVAVGARRGLLWLRRRREQPGRLGAGAGNLGR